MTVLGKRKAAGGIGSAEDAEDIFRRHFEAQFQPLDPGHKSKTAESALQEDDADSDSAGAKQDATRTDDSEDESEWGGLSDGEIDSDDEEQDAAPTVEVVDHSTSQAPKPAAMSKRELKAFMSSRPPDPNAPARPSPSAQQPASSSTLPEDAPSLLAQDLELRRLISESHLLSSPALTNLSSSSSSDQQPKTFAAGRIRHKTTDLRMQSLGSKESIHKQQRMPMNMRKGIVAAAGARESKRRKEARENNVVLERESGNSKKKRTRDRSRNFEVDRPGVGRMRGSELRISERDVRKIEGSRDVFGRKGGKGR